MELRPRSVKDGSEVLSDNVLDISVENNEVVVTTNYFVKESGFGEDYLGDNLETFSIQLADLGLVFEEGELKISLIYFGEEILSIKTILEDDSVVEGQVVTEPETIVDETANISEEIILKTEPSQETISGISLTEQERQILLDEFGDVSVETIRKEVIGDKLIIGYQFGGHRIEYYYDYPQDNLILEQKAENDRVVWLREIVRILSKDEVIVEPVEGLIEDTYEI